MHSGNRTNINILYLQFAASDLQQVLLVRHDVVLHGCSQALHPLQIGAARHAHGGYYHTSSDALKVFTLEDV